MMRPRERAKSLKRKVAIRQPRKTLLVFCEGERTEPEYFEALRREPAVKDTAAVDLRIETQHCGSVPLTLVREAIRAQSKAIGEDGEVDEIWCVFDVEWPRNHPNLMEAIELARQHGIRVAVSNPCFELWLALHFSDHGGWLDNDAARRLRRSHDKQADKGLDGSVYMPRRADAARHASRLEQRHERNGTLFPHDNPSSGMHLLIASVATGGG